MSLIINREQDVFLWASFLVLVEMGILNMTEDPWLKWSSCLARNYKPISLLHYNLTRPAVSCPDLPVIRHKISPAQFYGFIVKYIIYQNKTDQYHEATLTKNVKLKWKQFFKRK